MRKWLWFHPCQAGLHIFYLNSLGFQHPYNIPLSLEQVEVGFWSLQSKCSWPGTKTRISTHSTSIQPCNGSLCQCNKARKKQVEGWRLGKKELKLSLLTDGRIVCIEKSQRNIRVIRTNKWMYQGHRILGGHARS